MKAMILAAGLGTRLRPWTLQHPKALVPVGGVPMLHRVITSLTAQGFDDITVNIHHFGQQIIDFLNSKEYGTRINISDERGHLLDTGGGIVHASKFLCADAEPFLVHNVDILSDADLCGLMKAHIENKADATLLLSDRNSSRKLAMNENNRLVGWHNCTTEEHRPASYIPHSSDKEFAFSGIHCISPALADRMSRKYGGSPFPIMDFYLEECADSDIRCEVCSFSMIDIGKPETLTRANSIFI